MSITHSKPVIALDAAQRITRAAIEDAGARRLAIAVAVCDAGGGLVAFARMDAVAPGVGGFAIDKAYTAATTSRTSRDIGEQITRDPSHALRFGDGHRLVTWPGGMPILFGGRIIGAIGVSGASDEDDEDLAARALSALPDPDRPA